MSALIEALPQQENTLFEERKKKLFKVIQEGGNAFQGRFALAFNLNLKLDTCFANATEVLNAVEFGNESNA